MYASLHPPTGGRATKRGLTPIFAWCFAASPPTLGRGVPTCARADGTDKERGLFAPPDGSGWKELGKAFASKQICVSSFHFAAAAFLDVASQAVLARQTGGQVYLYQDVSGPMRDVWALKLEAELGRNLRRTFGFEGVMRVRCSKGFVVDEYLMGVPFPGQQEVSRRCAPGSVSAGSARGPFCVALYSAPGIFLLTDWDVPSALRWTCRASTRIRRLP